MKTPTLQMVLYEAQDGLCWICDEKMQRLGSVSQRGPSLDHVWPRRHYGMVGQVGITLLAHRGCNSARGDCLPNDDDIRKLIAVYRRLPRWWLLMSLKGLEREAARLDQVRGRAELLRELVA